MATVDRKTKSLDVTYVTSKGMSQMKAPESVSPKLQRMADAWKARTKR